MFTKKKPISPPIDPEFAKKFAEEMAKFNAEQPAPGTCITGMPLSVKFGCGKFCGRKVVEGLEVCYWHLRNTDKYSHQALARYFGEEITLAQALEKEVASGGSLEYAFLQDCRLGGGFLRRGPNLT